MRQITLAITHFNRFKLLKQCVEHVLHDERIGEVVISDDASTDGSFHDLIDWFSQMPKVRLYQNEVNLDCHRNKAKAVFRSSNDWVILFDSDNVLKPEALDSLYAIAEWDTDTIYAPVFAEPNFDYRAFSGTLASRSNVAALMARKHFATALNTCNYLVHRDSYTTVHDSRVDPHTADSIYQAFRWLESGRKIFFVPGFHYFHRVHDGSHYKQNHHKTGEFAGQIEEKLKRLK